MSKNLPPLTDHRFWKMLQEQCNTTKPMSRIAAELGVDIDDLCAWMMAYTSKPKKAQKAYVNRMSMPVFSPVASSDARRFEAWRKAKQGAAATRRMLEAAEL